MCGCRVLLKSARGAGCKPSGAESSSLILSCPAFLLYACSAETDLQLSKEEIEAALGVLDMDKSGSIDFGEFVNWWVNKVQPATAAATKAPQQ